jgi:hypothetical protein
VLEPPHRTSRDLYALPDRIVNRLVRDDDIASLRKRWYHTRYCREGLCVYDTCGCPNVSGDVGFCLDVYVLCTVEPWGAARTDTVGTEGGDGAVFQMFGGDEVIVVVGCEVYDCTTVRELRAGAGCTGRVLERGWDIGYGLGRGEG